MTAPDATPDVAHWQEFLPMQPGVTMVDFTPFARYAAIVERAEGLTRFRIFDFATRQSKLTEFPEPAYPAHSQGNAEYDTDPFRFSYESPITPSSHYACNMAT